MNKRIWKRFAAILLTACLLSGCGLPELKDMFRMEEDSDRFQAEDDGLIFPDDKVFRWAMLDGDLNYRWF